MLRELSIFVQQQRSTTCVGSRSAKQPPSDEAINFTKLPRLLNCLVRAFVKLRQLGAQSAFTAGGPPAHRQKSLRIYGLTVSYQSEPPTLSTVWSPALS